MIGKIQRLPLRDVWRHEALDFTSWMQNNIDVLNDVLNRNLVSAEREQSAGGFNVDLVAEDASGDVVVIENQLERSDHDHLGKLITYLTMLGAQAGVWIVADPRPEHVQALVWLNESSSADFYMVKVEAIQIADSPPAPLLTRIVGPSAEGRVVGQTKKELAERHYTRQKFFTELLARARARTTLHSTISPGHYSWIGTGAGRSGLTYNYVVTGDAGRAELYIDLGQDSDEANQRIFDQLAAERETIETTFGGPLEWQRLEGRRACRIKKDIKLGGYKDEDRWPEIQDAMIDAMIRLESALRPFIQQLRH